MQNNKLCDYVGVHMLCLSAEHALQIMHDYSCNPEHPCSITSFLSVKKVMLHVGHDNFEPNTKYKVWMADGKEKNGNAIFLIVSIENSNVTAFKPEHLAAEKFYKDCITIDEKVLKIVKNGILKELVA